MLDKTNYQEIPSVSVPPAKENGSTFAEPATVLESSEDPVKEHAVTAQLPAKQVSVIGSSMVFKGEISADDEIYIHGVVEGTIAHDVKRIIVCKKGRVSALIHANSVTVEGHVDGDIHANELVELLDGARVEGNIFCSCIRMEKGAQFNGTVHMAPQGISVTR